MSAMIPLADYTTGGSVLTFAIPMLLFVVIAGTLYSVFLGTRKVPGHHVEALARTPGPAPATSAVTDTATSPEGGGAAPSPGPAPTSMPPERADQ
jgi:hypothetical protein